MDARTRNLFVAAFVLFVVVAGGAAILLSSTEIRDPSAPSGATAAVGVITHVASASFGDVTGITLRTTDGQVLDFVVGQLENAAENPPGHLALHQATAAPVRVWYRMDGSQRVAIRIEDALV
jgi:hypothetical protein